MLHWFPRDWAGPLISIATRDGFNSVSFYSKCDGKPNTVTIVKTGSNCVFGGFTSSKWNIDKDAIEDANSFVFSLRREGISKSEKFMIKPKNSKSVIYGNRRYGPILGSVDTSIIYSRGLAN